MSVSFSPLRQSLSGLIGGLGVKTGIAFLDMFGKTILGAKLGRGLVLDAERVLVLLILVVTVDKGLVLVGLSRLSLLLSSSLLHSVLPKESLLVAGTSCRS